MRNKSELNSMTSIGLEAGRCLLAWAIAASVALPSTVMAQEAAQQLPPPTAAPAAVPAHKSSDELLQEQFDVMKALEPFNKQMDAIAAKISAGNATDNDQKDYSNLMHDSADLRARQEELRNEIGTNPTLGTYLGADGKPVAATLETEKQSAPGDQLTPEQIEKYFGKGQKTPLQTVAGGVSSFSSQYVAFSVATGFIAMSQLVLADPRDPNALENWEKQTFNLMGAVGFGFFMMANHGVIDAYKLMRRKAMGPQEGHFVNYLGMSAGMLAQSVFSDLWRDQDMWKCVRPYYDTKAKPVAGACEKFRGDWLIHAKILQYAPSVLGMMGSTAIAQAGRYGIQKTLSSVPRNSNGYIRLVSRGIKLMPKSEFVKNAARFAGAKVLGLTDFVAFLVIDSYWVEEPANQMWQEIRENHVDLKAWADNRLGFHSEFLWPKGYQPIQNALDVEATTPYTAHTYLMDLYRKMQANGWKKPAPVESCVPANIAAAAKAAQPDDTKNMWFWQRWLTESSRAKSPEQLSCEVFARPSDLLARYSDTNKEWRGVLLSPFNASQANWIEMIAQFSESYGASYALANYMATQNFNVATKGQAAPDLSREALAKVISAPLPSDDDNADVPETHQSWFLDGTWVPTPLLVDYVVAGAACGPDPVLTPGNDQGDMVERAFTGTYSFFARKMVSPNFVSTPYGSSLRFVPPKLTDKSRAICQNVQGGLYSTVNYMVGGFLPELGNKPATKNPFTGPFTDEGGKSYNSLAEYAYQNLDPQITKSTVIGPLFATWWNDHFVKVIKPVWARYDSQYKMFLNKYYAPALFDRTFREGCRATADLSAKKTDATGLLATTQKVNGSAVEQKCSEDTNAYRVSNGVFLAIETELRNYMRGWYSLYVSSLGTGKNKDAAKAAFMKDANALIAGIRLVDPKALQADSFEGQIASAQQLLAQLNSTVAASINASPSADNQFRLEMNTKFNELVGKLLQEEAEDANIYHMLEFGHVSGATAASGATNGGAVQGLDSPVSPISNMSPAQ